MKSKGFTLIELLIVVAIILILAVVAINALRDADAKEAPVTINSTLEAQSVSYVYRVSEGGNDGLLFILGKGKATWANAAAVCSELKPIDSRLAKVIISDGSGTTNDTELTWSDDGTKLTNLQGRDEAECL